MEARLRPAGRHDDPFFQQSRRYYVGFNRYVMMAGSVGGVVELVGLFFVAKQAGAQRFIIDARASDRHLLNLPSGPWLTGQGFCQFHGQRTLGTGLWVQRILRMRFIRCAFLVGCKLFALPAVLASEVGYCGK